MGRDIVADMKAAKHQRRVAIREGAGTRLPLPWWNLPSTMRRAGDESRRQAGAPQQAPVCGSPACDAR
jgi:hypothetical protein